MTDAIDRATAHYALAAEGWRRAAAEDAAADAGGTAAALHRLAATIFRQAADAAYAEARRHDPTPTPAPSAAPPPDNVIALRPRAARRAR